MATQELKIVRILLVGDPQCGKTSVILALVGEEFPLFVPPRAEEITIPGDVTPEKVPTHIVDYSAQEQDEDMLQEEITKAHVVCVMYDVTSEDALERVTSYWLPLIKHCSAGSGLSKPIILAGNKADLPFDTESQSQRLQEILNTCMEVETGIECSAKDLHNVSELFYFAQKAVLHPTAPLYSPNDRQLKPECVEALERIFKICDGDNDGILNDQELNDFQIRCFDAPLQPQALQDVKRIVKKNTSAGVHGDGLTLEGFLFLNKLFIQRGRHETTWKVLRKFGYSNTVTLKDEYLQPVFSPQPGSSVELSGSGYQFLTDLFNKYDRDGDKALSPQEQEDMFSLCPDYPWDDQLISLTVETNPEGWITLNGFLAFWTLQTSIDYTYTAQFLAWMGYPVLERGTLASALQEVRPHERQKSVYRCRVLGSKNCGKTTFVRGLVGKEQSPYPDIEGEEAVSVKSLTLAESHIYLVLHESSFVPDDSLDQYSSGQAISGVLNHCDVACLLYDTSDASSFKTAAQLFNAVEGMVSQLVPCVFIATKSDQPRVKQDYEQQPEELCKEYSLPQPHKVSASASEVLDSVYNTLATIARDPASNLPSSFRIPRWVKLASLGLMLGASLGAIVYLLHRSGRLKFGARRSSVL